MPLFNRDQNSPFVYDETNALVGALGTRFVPKTYTNFNSVSVVGAAGTFGAVGTNWNSNSGNVRLTGTGAHGLTTAVVITPAINTGVYVTWTGGSGVSGVYPVTVIDTDTTGTNLTINLPYVSATVTGTVGDSGIPGVINWTSHGRSVGNVIRFTGTPPSPLSTGTNYYVSSVLDANRFTVSSSAGGAPIEFTTAGSSPTCILWYGSAAVVAATNAITLASFTVEGGTLTNSGNMECNALFSMTSSANAKRLIMTYGGSALFDSGAGSYTTTTGVNVNKIAWARGPGTVVTSAATATGHGTTTATGGIQTFTLAYNTDLTFAITATPATANEVITLQGYQVELH
jgi:hypothetical protein